MIMVSFCIVMGMGMVLSSSTVSWRVLIIGWLSVVVASVMSPSFLFLDGEFFAPMVGTHTHLLVCRLCFLKSTQKLI